MILTKAQAATRWPTIAQTVTLLRRTFGPGVHVAFAADSECSYGAELEGPFVAGRVPVWPVKRWRHA